MAKEDEKKTTTEDEVPETESESTEEESEESSQEERDDQASGSSDDSDDGDSHYQAEIDKLNKRLKKADYTATSEKKKRKELERQLEESDGFYSEDDIARIVEEKINGFKSEMQSSQLAQEIDAAGSTPAERELIRMHYENSIRLTGDIAQDVQTAKLLANAGRYTKNAQEIEAARRAGKPSSDGASSQSGGGEDYSDIIEALSPADKALLARRGLTPEEYARRQRQGK